jgi:predicted nucleic-acid-binding protein
MRVAVDTNILVRAVVRDDAEQARAATRLLKEAEIIAISVACLCEFVWVLRRVYHFTREDISAAINALLAAGNVTINRPAVEAGLTIFDAGGDFADGVIAYEGSWLGGETFASFDKRAVELLVGGGQKAMLLS